MEIREVTALFVITSTPSPLAFIYKHVKINASQANQDNGMLNTLANQSRYVFSVHDTTYQVITYTLKDHGFNSLYHCELNIVSESEIFADALIDKPGYFKVFADPDLCLQGDITSFTVLDKKNHLFYYQTLLEPSLSRLKGSCLSDIYTDYDLQTLFSVLLKRHDIFDVSYEIPKHSHYFELQYQQSDFDVFIALIIQYGFIFYYGPYAKSVGKLG